MERFTVMLVTILIGLVSSLYAAWLMVDIFNWFVVPALDVGPINLAVMWGLLYFASYFFASTNINVTYFEIKSLGATKLYATLVENLGKNAFSAIFVTGSWFVSRFIILPMV